MSETAAAAWTPPAFGTPCWYEIPAVDVLACKKFYEALFPSWSWKPATEKYPEERIAMFSFAEGGLSGGITQIAPDVKKVEVSAGMGVTLYLLVASIEETKKKIEGLGGVSLTEKTPEGDFGFHMHIRDVAGNRFAIYEFKQ